jgi:hypothetical protein
LPLFEGIYAFVIISTCVCSVRCFLSSSFISGALL